MSLDIQQLFNTMINFMFTFVILILVFSVFSGISKSVEKVVKTA